MFLAYEDCTKKNIEIYDLTGDMVLDGEDFNNNGQLRMSRHIFRSSCVRIPIITMHNLIKQL